MKELIINPNFSVIAKMDSTSKSGNLPFLKEKIEKSLKNNQSSKCISCNKCFEIYKTKYKHCIFDDNVNVQLYENFYK